MTQPLVIDLPHSLGAEEARRRIAGSIGKLSSHIPGGAAEVTERWDANRLYLDVHAMGQSVASHVDVEERKVRVEILLPGMLGMFGSAIEAWLRHKGGQVLEDKRLSGTH